MAENGKRPSSPEANGGSEIVLKKQKVGDGAVVKITPKETKEGIRRTSGLMAPIMLLTGHSGEVFTAKFSPDGRVIASGSHDKRIFLWRTYGECENYMMMQGHKNAILELHWTTDGDKIISASPDKTVRAWDTLSGEQVKKMAEHDNFVNSCCPLKRGPPLLVSGSDDGTAKVWDLRHKRSVVTMTEQYQVTSVAFSEAGDQIYTGGIDNVVKAWDLRRNAVLTTLHGHTDTITSMRVSPDGTHLLTNAMHESEIWTFEMSGKSPPIIEDMIQDNTLRIWDMRPYAPANRCTKILSGHKHSFEKNLLKCDWSPDGKQVTCGSADRYVYVWDVASRKILYKLPGHNGSVNEVVFHPEEVILCSASSDRQLYLGELAS